MKAAIIQNIGGEYKQSTTEILDLTEAANYEIELHFRVDMEYPHSQTYLREGKLEEFKMLLEDHEDVKKIIVDDRLRPNQTFNLEEEINLDVIDKPMLILEIFEKKANSRDIKMQIDLAQLKYAVPRMVVEMGEAVRSERAGYGGSGEQVTDILVSDMNRRIKNLERKIDNYRSKNADKLKSRHPRLPIVGYYSSGKTTLFNILAEAERDVGEEAFTTMILKTKRSLITGYAIDLIDTVGLVDLPSDILSAFDLMLESIFTLSGMILCLDSSLPFPQWEAQLEDFHDYIERFTHNKSPRIILFLTKTDKAVPEVIEEMKRTINQQDWLHEYIIITSTKDEPDKIRQDFIEVFEQLFDDELVEFHYQNLSPSLASKIHDIARVEKQEWHNDGTTTMTGIAPKSIISEIRGELVK